MKLLISFFKEDWQFFHYKINKIINGFFYFIRKIPGLKKIISERIYASYDLKSAIGLILTALDVPFSLLKKIAALAIVIFLHIFLADFLSGQSLDSFFNHETLQQGAGVWFLVVVMVWGFYNQFSVISTQKMIDFYTEFALSRNQFILGQKFIEIFKSAFFYLIVGILYGFLANQFSLILFLPLSYLAGNFLYFVFCRWLYMFNFRPGTRRLIAVFVTVILAGIVFAMYYWQLLPIFTTIITSWPALVIWLLLALLAFRWSWQYPWQNEFIQKTLIQSVGFYQANLNTASKNQEYIGQGLKMQKQLTVNHDTRVDKLKGNDYLNALLFSRYSQIFNKKIRYLLIGFGAVTLLIIGLRFFNSPGFITEEMTLQLLPALFFLMYFLSFGKQIVQMLFVNCDSSMLYYPFYRDGGTILKGFTYRLRQTFKYNSIIIAGLFLLFVFLQVLNNFYLSWQFFGVLLLLLIALAFLFSFHELFIYYLIQPFTADMTVQSPLYKVITWIFYYFAYMNTQVRVSGFLYVMAISVICLLYVGIGLVIIYRVAPKTFKIKN